MSICRDNNWRLILIAFGLFGAWVGASAQVEKPFQQPPLETRWAADVSSTNAHSEYPRPMLVRPDWLNLNGQWDYGVTSWLQTNKGTFTEKISVPFPVESVLSGVGRHFVSERQRLWYRRIFKIPKDWQGQRILLHFEASDWETTVWLNGQKLGTHKGGYDPFSFDITDALTPEGGQELVVSVHNPAETGDQPRGKQRLHPTPPFYTANSGIWQTVWLEPVPQTYIQSLKLVPDIDTGVLHVTVFDSGETNDVTVEVSALDEETTISRTNGLPNKQFDLPVPNAKAWSPDCPFLYGSEITLIEKGKKVDTAASYFGMRKISIGKSEEGFPQLMLNNKPLFQLGVLDQGYWPDGIYTAPTDEALRSDIELMKKLGFNLCRKHMEVGSERWYYWCDKLGLLVWQDMPNGDRPATASRKEIQRRPDSAQEFEQELNKMIVGRGNHPCIVNWVLFNQGWGQYDTARLTDMVKKLDPSRLVTSASGWYDMGTGDINDLHAYPGPAVPEQDGKRACVEGECGGLGLVAKGHLWGGITPWDTTFYNNASDLTDAYAGLISRLKTFKEKNGLAGAVITQLTDVEMDMDGFVSYDRAVVKMPEATVKQLNEDLIQSGSQ